MPTEPRGAAASCRDLVKTYWRPTGQVPALRGVSAEFAAGALTAVIGPSGSGKSSLLRLLAGMDRPSSGSVRVDGIRLDAAPQRRLRHLRRHTIGYVFQRPSDNFISYLTVGEHLRVAAGRSRGKDLDWRALLAELEIEDRIDHLPAQLSGGEQQRAAFAQTLMAGSLIVLADEPTAELDSTSASAVLARVRALVASGITVVIATHDTNVVKMSDGVVELDHGIVRRAVGAAASDASAGRLWAALQAARPGIEAGIGVGAPHLELVPTSGPQQWRPPAHRRVPGMSVIELDDIVKSYRRGDEVVRALGGVSAVLGEGELVGVVGRSGSGKTTLLNVIAGWERPDEGRVVRSDEREEHDVLAWSNLAVLPQKMGLMDELTIRENIEYPARLRGDLEERAVVADELIETLGLGALQARYPKETSVGEQQRAALARALVLTPRVLLADEPTGHQDRGWTRVVFEALRVAVSGGTSCLIATHNREVIGYLDRVLPMSDGRLLEEPDMAWAGSVERSSSPRG